MPKFLSDLKFNWTKPHNDEADFDGFWMFDAFTHPHPQWTTIMIQSDPRYYATWGIQQLLNQWKTKVLEDCSPPHNVFVPSMPPYELHLYEEAMRLEVDPDLDVYREALDNLVLFNSEQIGKQFERIGMEQNASYTEIRTNVVKWRTRFDQAFS